LIKPELPQNWPAPDEYLIELGRISALWGSLESNVNIAISKLAGYEETLDWRAATLTVHSNFKQRVDILSTLCDELQYEYPHISAYKIVIAKIKKVQTRRNRYAHNAIYFNEETGKVETSFMSARGKLKITIEEVNIDDLKAISADIHEVMLDLHHLITQVRYSPVWKRK